MQDISAIPVQSMMQFNTRSVLRPEYLNYPNPDYICYGNFYNDRRVNTNTAPVYTNDNPCPQKQRRLVRRVSSYPYFRPEVDMPSPNVSPDRCEYPINDEHLGYNTATSIPVPCSDEFGESRWGSDLTRKSKPNSRAVVGFAVNSRQRNSCPNSDSVSPNGLGSGGSSSHPRSYSHGQAEQLRRSRESTTFALIDNQLSKPPLSQVRDLYLHNRIGSSSSNSAPTRTTKKANLSAVHTIVRFRIKDYLVPLLSHLRRMQTTLADDLERESIGSGDARAAAILGTVQVPCSLSCEHCERLKVQLDRYMPSRKVMYSKNLVPVKSSLSSKQYPPASRGSPHVDRMYMRPGSPLEPAHLNRRFSIPQPLAPSSHLQAPSHNRCLNSSHRPLIESDIELIGDVVVPTSPSIKPENSNTSPLSSPSSPLLNLDAFDRNSDESDLLDRIQLDEVNSLSFAAVHSMLDDVPLSRRTRGDSSSTKLQDFIDMPLEMNFDFDEDPAELHNLLTGYHDFKLEQFADETSGMPSCDELDALARLPLLEGLGRPGDCELMASNFKQECPSPTSVLHNLGCL